MCVGGGRWRGRAGGGCELVAHSTTELVKSRRRTGDGSDCRMVGGVVQDRRVGWEKKEEWRETWFGLTKHRLLRGRGAQCLTRKEVGQTPLGCDFLARPSGRKLSAPGRKGRKGGGWHSGSTDAGGGKTSSSWEFTRLVDRDGRVNNIPFIIISVLFIHCHPLQPFPLRIPHTHPTAILGPLHSRISQTASRPRLAALTAAD